MNNSTESKKKKIGIVGFGYVGQAMARFFEGKYDILIYDLMWSEKAEGFAHRFPNYQLASHENKGFLFADCDLTVICVPTPMKEDGSCDTSAVSDSIEWLKNGRAYPQLTLIKSTVPPRFTQKYIDEKHWIAFSPEYLGESAYVTHYWKGYPDPENLKTHEFQIFGGDRYVTSKIIPFFRSIMGPETRYLQTDATTAELAKYMENCFFATKVSFCNEFKNIADTFGADYNELRELWLQDGRINRNHTLVFDEKRGYGGKCYPKDMAAMVAASEEAGYVPKILKQVIESNEDFKKQSI